MNTQIRSRFALVAALVISSAWIGSSRAALVLMGTGSNSGTISATGHTASAAVYFYYDTADTKTLIIDLVNTSAKTTDPADALTGLAFDISGNPTYATAPTQTNLTPSLVLTGLGVTSDSLGAGDWNNTWTNLRANSNLSVVGDYGISTTGFSGAFSSGGLGSENNSIVGAATTLTGGFNNAAHQPLAVTGLEFKLTFTTDISKVQFSNAQFLFGSAGTGILGVNVNPSVPEPSSIAAFGIGIVGMALMRRRVRKFA